MRRNNSKQGIPQRYIDLIGTKVDVKGCVFAYGKELDKTEYDVLDCRWGTATIVNINDIVTKGDSNYEYPTVELLLKNNSMKKAQWSKPFPVEEINLKGEIID